eukprot:COSAG05_NODE_5429_length_1177_cov_1.104824_1_plen_88_part_00
MGESVTSLTHSAAAAISPVRASAAATIAAAAAAARTPPQHGLRLTLAFDLPDELARDEGRTVRVLAAVGRPLKARRATVPTHEEYVT